MKFDVYVDVTETKRLSIEANSEVEAKMLAETKVDELLSSNLDISNFEIGNITLFNESEEF